jgi:hypothetical protein
VLAGIVLVGVLAVGPGLGLAPGDESEPSPPPPPEVPAPEPPEEPDPGWPLAAVLLGLAAAAAALAAQRPGSALGLRPPENTLVVFLPGHGQGPGEEVYAEFVEEMGLDPEDARYFDYRWVTGDTDAKRAAALAPTDRSASSLNAYLAGVSDGERPVWLVGFSKGSAVIAELVAAWDRGAPRPNPGVTGAMLLDPPMARGIHGKLQSIGQVAGLIPDDGGYDPVDCSLIWFWCRDARDRLGEASGVEVIVVRNPRAGLTSFGDHPEGLRVVDAPDNGPGPWGQLLRNPLRLFGRLSEAHEAVLSDPAVARCLVAEMWWPGSCELGREPAAMVFHPLRARARSPLARAV